MYLAIAVQLLGRCADQKRKIHETNYPASPRVAFATARTRSKDAARVYCPLSVRAAGVGGNHKHARADAKYASSDRAAHTVALSASYCFYVPQLLYRDDVTRDMFRRSLVVPIAMCVLLHCGNQPAKYICRYPNSRPGSDCLLRWTGKAARGGA